MILAEAADLISRQGYAATTMDDIAAAAKMTKAALYYYFQNKEDVLLQICGDAIDTSLRDLDVVTEDPSLDARGRLRGIVVQQFTSMNKHREVFSVFYQEFWRVDHPGTAAIRKRQREYDRRVQEIVQAGVDDGSFRPLPVRLVVLALIGMCEWSYRWLAKESRNAEEVAEVFADIFLEGLNSGDSGGATTKVRGGRRSS